MLQIDLRGKRALVAGVADDAGYGFAISRALIEAGASVVVGTWPPAYGIFTKLLERGKLDASRVLPDGSKLDFERIYPLDAEYDSLDDVPQEVRESKRYRDHGDFTIGGLKSRLLNDFGDQSVDFVVHSLANGPEVKRPLIKTTRAGYLAALSASSYSFVSMVRHLGPMMRSGGGFLCLSYYAAEKVVPGYGGGMSSAKAALESDTRVLAYEAGREWKLRVNCISAGPLASRAASAIGFVDNMVDYCQRNAPLANATKASEVGQTAAFLLSPLASAVTGSTMYVDQGYHAMGMALDSVPDSIETPRG